MPRYSISNSSAAVTLRTFLLRRARASQAIATVLCLHPMEPPPGKLSPYVNRLKPGERFLTFVTHDHLPELATPAAVEDGVWDQSDNAFQQYGAFSENRLVAMPLCPDFHQANTLFFPAWTTWDSLSGLISRVMEPGHTVGTQNTKSVRTFTLQVCHVLLLHEAVPYPYFIQVFEGSRRLCYCDS